MRATGARLTRNSATLSVLARFTLVEASDFCAAAGQLLLCRQTLGEGVGAAGNDSLLPRRARRMNESRPARRPWLNHLVIEG